MTEDKTIESEVKKLFQHLGVEAKIEVSDDEQGGKKVQIETPDSGLLIGRSGMNLEALQIFINVLLYQKAGPGKIILDIGDFKKARAEKLKNLAQKTALEVKREKRAKEIANLLPWERRVVHLSLASDLDVATYSEGEGWERKLIVYPRPKTSSAREKVGAKPKGS